MPPGNDAPENLSLAEILRQARRQAQASLLTRIADGQPVQGAEDDARDVIRVFRHYVSVEIEAGDGDLDKRLGQKLNPALALALTVLPAATEQGKPDSSASSPPGSSADLKVHDGLSAWLVGTRDAQEELRAKLDGVSPVTTYEAARDVIYAFDELVRVEVDSRNASSRLLTQNLRAAFRVAEESLGAAGAARDMQMLLDRTR